MKWWKIEIKSGHKKSLELLGVNKNLINYLTTSIPMVIDDKEYIYVCYDEKRNNVWKTDWTWHFELGLKNDDIYYGTFNIKKFRKEKLKRLKCISTPL